MMASRSHSLLWLSNACSQVVQTGCVKNFVVPFKEGQHEEFTACCGNDSHLAMLRAYESGAMTGTVSYQLDTTLRKVIAEDYTAELATTDLAYQWKAPPDWSASLNRTSGQLSLTSRKEQDFTSMTGSCEPAKAKF
jgi:hypothetical protein